MLSCPCTPLDDDTDSSGNTGGGGNIEQAALLSPAAPCTPHTPDTPHIPCTPAVPTIHDRLQNQVRSTAKKQFGSKALLSDEESSDDSCCGGEGEEVDEGEGGAEGVAGIEGEGTEVVEDVEGVEGVEGTKGLKGVEGAEGAEGIEGIEGVEGVGGVEGVEGAEGVVGAEGIEDIEGIEVTGGDSIEGVEKGDKEGSISEDTVSFSLMHADVPFDVDAITCNRGSTSRSRSRSSRGSTSSRVSRGKAIGQETTPITTRLPSERVTYTHFKRVHVGLLDPCNSGSTVGTGTGTGTGSGTGEVDQFMREHGLNTVWVCHDIPLSRPQGELGTGEVQAYNTHIQQADAAEAGKDYEGACRVYLQALFIYDGDPMLHGKLAYLTHKLQEGCNLEEVVVLENSYSS